jgi:hypothetical protein
MQEWSRAEVLGRRNEGRLAKRQPIAYDERGPSAGVKEKGSHFRSDSPTTRKTQGYSLAAFFFFLSFAALVLHAMHYLHAPTTFVVSKSFQLTS